MGKICCTLLVIVFACVGCAAGPTTPIYYASTFNKAQAERLLRPGKNSIIVNSYVVHKLEGYEEMQTCAGGSVLLMPATERAAEYVQILFGSRSWIYNSRTGSINSRIANEDPDFWGLTRLARCDSDGYAVFDHIADGDFYVFNQLNSFFSVQKVSVKGGQTKKVIL